MPLILKSKHDRIAFGFGRQSAFRSISELVDQLQDQLQAERAQHRCALTLKEQELAEALRELAEARFQLARIEAFANAPSPSAMLY
jgi:hypothetical protein